MQKSISRADLDLVILDLDGTLYSAGRVIAGAAETVIRLRTADLHLRFVTNTFTKPAGQILQRLAGFGIVVEPYELITPHDVLASFFKSRPDIRCSVFANPDLIARMDYLPRRADSRAELVLVADSGELWNYGAFDALVSLLHDGAELMASSGAVSFIGKDGKSHPDTGALVRLLEASSGKSARIMGKPGADMARHVISDAGFDPKRTIVIGDDPEVDVAFARVAGAHAALVHTGKRKGDPVSPEPDASLRSVAELPGFLGI